MIFDYVTAASRAGIREDKLERLREFFHAEFPSDEMMAELHILRAVLSVERGDTTVEEILSRSVVK